MFSIPFTGGNIAAGSAKVNSFFKRLPGSGPCPETGPLLMSWKRRVHGGVLGFIGFMLSPLSWWNDLFVNVPLALGFAWLVSIFYRPAFQPALIIGYWLTNLLGLVLMHKGARNMFSSEDPKAYSVRELFKDVLISLLYTLLIVLLIQLKILRPITDYFPKK